MATVSALAPGGVLVVSDLAHEGGDGAISATTGWNELFFYLVSAAQSWPDETTAEWMRAQGFEGIKKRRLMTSPNNLLTGIKPT